LAALRRRLPRYLVPLTVDWRDVLPRNANGKFDRQRLRHELAARFSDVEIEDLSETPDCAKNTG
jgi:acyl-CoA synthetase (AMP-forming)/AMP-acid ligase II